jgi:SAM-dependent methyltransferase
MAKPLPSARDLEIWRQARHDLMDWQYRGLVGALESTGHRIVGRWLESYRASTILEIGCGHGHHTMYTDARPAVYIGLDSSMSLLGTARQRAPGTRLVNGDACALPIANRSIDCVISMYCFEHLERLPECLAEVRRVLRPGGPLFVGLPAEGGLLYGIGRFFTTKRYMERKYGLDYDAIVKWEHCNTAHEVTRALAAQFTIRRRNFVPFRVPSVHLSAVICYECVSSTEAA